MNTKKISRTWNKQDLHIAIATGVLALILSLHYVTIRGAATSPPLYDHGQYLVISKLQFSDFLKPTKFETYYRFSPTGLLLIGWIDTRLIAPIMGIPIDQESAICNAGRLQFLFHGLLATLCIMAFYLLRLIGSSPQAAFLGASFVMTHKAFYFYLNYVSCLAAYLLIIYCLASMIFFFLYIKRPKLYFLAGYYTFLILAIFAWEQSLNFLAFIVFSSAIYLLVKIEKNKKLVLHSIVAPICLTIAYLAIRIPYVGGETRAVTEAQQVFTYPSYILMVEDIFSNAVLHTANIFEGVFLPWPMQSYSVLKNLNMDALNLYNSTYAGGNASVQYRAFGLLYAGMIFTLVIAIGIGTVRKCVQTIHNPNSWFGLGGILLTFFGFAIHLPIMSRTYFLMPGYFIGYKHSLSIVGGALWIAWIATTLKDHFTWTPRKTWIICVAISSWFLFSNLMKIYAAPHAVGFPW